MPSSTVKQVVLLLEMPYLYNKRCFRMKSTAYEYSLKVLCKLDSALYGLCVFYGSLVGI